MQSTLEPEHPTRTVVYLSTGHTKLVPFHLFTLPRPRNRAGVWPPVQLLKKTFPQEKWAPYEKSEYLRALHGEGTEEEIAHWMAVKAEKVRLTALKRRCVSRYRAVYKRDVRNLYAKNRKLCFSACIGELSICHNFMNSLSITFSTFAKEYANYATGDTEVDEVEGSSNNPHTTKRERETNDDKNTAIKRQKKKEI